MRCDCDKCCRNCVAFFFVVLLFYVDTIGNIDVQMKELARRIGSFMLVNVFIRTKKKILNSQHCFAGERFFE